VPAGSLLDTLGILSCEFDAVLSGVRESVCAELLPALRELEALLPRPHRSKHTCRGADRRPRVG